MQTTDWPSHPSQSLLDAEVASGGSPLCQLGQGAERAIVALDAEVASDGSPFCQLGRGAERAIESFES